MQKTEKIVIKFKNGKVSCKGNASNYHTWIGCSKLNLNEVEPTAIMKLGKFCKKFIRCIKFALSKDNDVTINRSKLYAKPAVVSEFPLQKKN